MNRRLFWKLCLIIATGTVTLFYVINILTSRAEEGMSFIATEHQQQLNAWADHAERLYLAGETLTLRHWLEELQAQENTSAWVIESELRGVAGSQLTDRLYEAFTLGRSVKWKIHLYFEANPIIEFNFADRHTHFSILLPQRMRPGAYWDYTNVALQIILPMILLIILSIVLYRHIMSPLRELEKATQAFSRGKLDVRVRQLLGNRSDELAELANTFDMMADRISDHIISQRQLIADLSHELRTPLTRLDIAVDSLKDSSGNSVEITRVERESKQIRKLVEDTLTLAWLENERPNLAEENLDLVDLLDVLIDDARFEFPDRSIMSMLPEHAPIEQTSHRSLGQALENIIRNAMRFTPPGQSVSISLIADVDSYRIDIADQGPGVNEAQLELIFQPFYRADRSRSAPNNSFGLGLALARRQISAVGGRVLAKNLADQGFLMSVTLPRERETNDKYELSLGSSNT
jgi:two-component system sensor histidine kinase PfeS